MSLSLAIWLASGLAKVSCLAATWRPNLGRGILWLRWYLLLSLTADVAGFSILRTFGYRSPEYKLSYYAADLALQVFGFFVLIRLVELAFQHSSLKLEGLRTLAIMLFSGVACCSAAIVFMMRGDLAMTNFAHEMEQNLGFLGMVMAMLLFIGINVLQVPGVQFRRIVLCFSVLYASGAILYSLSALLPRLLAGIDVYAMPSCGLLTLALMAYSLWVPEPERKARPSPAAALLTKPSTPVTEATW